MGVASDVREAELALINAPFVPGGWQRAVGAVAAATRSAGAQLIGVGGPLVIPLNVVVGDFAGPTRHFTDAALYGPCNWRLNSVGVEGSIQHETHFAAYAADHDTSDYDDAVADLDLPFGCQSAFLVEPGRMIGLTILRRRRDGACDADTLERFARLRYQAARAARAQLALENEAASLMLGDLDTVPCATLLLDRTGMVRALTAAAERALRDGPFRLACGHFRVHDAVDNHYLQRAFGRLLASDGFADVLLHQVRIDRGRWDITVARLPTPPHALGFEPTLAVTLRPGWTGRRKSGQSGRNASQRQDMTMSDSMVDDTSGQQALRYRPIVVAIHWLTAALIVTQVWLGFTFHDLPKGTPERAELFTWHKTVGVTILLLALVRLGVRLINPPPPFPSELAKWERAFAVWTHRLFYFLIIALPLTGLMAVSKGGPTTTIIGGLTVPTIPLPALGGLHEPLVFATLFLLALHVAGALKHQFIDRGPSADRMWPFRSTR